VFQNPLSEIGAKINRTFRAMILAAAAGAAGVAALFFFSLGLFLWLQQIYGTVQASLALGGGYTALALIALVGVLIVQRQRPVTVRPAAAAAATPQQQQWWADPVMLTTGLQVLRIIGRRRMLPLAIAAVVAGFVFGDSVKRYKKPPQPQRAKPNGKGTFDEARH
jgi:hypothetical protein